MNALISRRKQSAASIRLPKHTTGGQRGLESGATLHGETRRTRRKRAEAVLSRGFAAPQGEVHPWEGVLFVVVLVVIVLLANVYVDTKVNTKQMLFEMGEAKGKREVNLMADQERLQEQVSAYKRPERIEERARQRGMVTPAGGQIITVP